MLNELKKKKQRKKTGIWSPKFVNQVQYYLIPIHILFLLKKNNFIAYSIGYIMQQTEAFIYTFKYIDLDGIDYQYCIYFLGQYN